MPNISPADLAAYLDEALPADAMASLEDALRRDSSLAAQLAEIIARRDAGVHSLGDIGVAIALAAPTREQLGSHLLGVLPDEESAYIAFHIEHIGCRICQANLADLKAQQSAAAKQAEQTSTRRRKYFQSSAGHLGTAKR